MKLTDSFKGFLLALVSVIAVSNVYIFSKAALMEVSIPQFGVYWFGFGLLWILIYAWYKKTYQSLLKLPRSCYLTLFLLGFLEVLSAYFFFKAIDTIANPSIVSFIGNISPAFVIALSFFFLKERFNTLELWGILMALSGAFIISYKGNANFKDLFIEGAEYVFYSSLISAVTALIVKKKIEKIHPIILTINRSLFLFIFSLIALAWIEQKWTIPGNVLKNIFIGSLLGPFLTVISGYLALQYIPLSRKAIIDSTRGLFVLFGAYLYFNDFPRQIAIFGGFITIIGVLLIAFGKSKIKHLETQQ